MKKLKWILGVLIVLGFIGGLGGIKALQIVTMIEAGQSMGPQPETVALGKAEKTEWEQRLQSVGTVSSLEGIMLAAEAEGVIREIQFESGSRVEEGQLLLRLDDEQQRAELSSADAALKLAKLTHDRSIDLLRDNSISQAEFDRSQASLNEAEAKVEAAKAILAKREVRAPFTGKLGIRQVSLGEYVSRGTPLVSLQSLEQIAVDFELPQRWLSLVKEGQTVRVEVDSWPGQSFTGTLSALNPEVDTVTRTLSLQATLDNPDEALRPGMFVRVTVVQPEKRAVVMIPKSAVLFATYGDTVFLVDGEPEVEDPREVRQQIIRLGESRGDFTEVLSGLQGGETLVTAGAFKLRQGALVVPSEVGLIKPALEPSPEEG